MIGTKVTVGITVMKKTPNHPFYGKGSENGYAVVEVDETTTYKDYYSELQQIKMLEEGATIIIGWYDILEVDLRGCEGHPFYISMVSPEGGFENGGTGEEEESPFYNKSRFPAIDNGKFIFAPYQDFSALAHSEFMTNLHDYLQKNPMTNREYRFGDRGTASGTASGQPGFLKLYYCCDYHKYMGGEIIVANKEYPFKPVVGPSLGSFLSPDDYDDDDDDDDESLVLKNPDMQSTPSLTLSIGRKFGKSKNPSGKESSASSYLTFKNRMEMDGFDRPTSGCHSYHADGRYLYVTEQGGKIFQIDLFTTARSSNPEDHAGLWMIKEEVADLSFLQPNRIKSESRLDSFDERGLLGMTIVPYRYRGVFGSGNSDGMNTPVSVFVFTSTGDQANDNPTGSKSVNHVSCVFHLSAEFNQATEGLFFKTRENVDYQKQKVLCVPEPYKNHNGGNLLYDEVNKHLYIGLGDGGSQGDPEFRVQKKTSAMGKILRIDVSEWIKKGGPPEKPYKIPYSNPLSSSGSSSFFKKNGYDMKQPPIYIRQSLLSTNRITKGYKTDRSIYDIQLTKEDIDKFMGRTVTADKTAIIKALSSPLPEIYVWGLRNPWGMAFHPKITNKSIQVDSNVENTQNRTILSKKLLKKNNAEQFAAPGSIILSDVGENRTEEINVIPPLLKKGEQVNLGWPWFEGSERTRYHNQSNDNKMKRQIKQTQKKQLYPTIVYHHGDNTTKSYRKSKISKETGIDMLQGSGVVGGYIYTGGFSPRLYGSYIFGDVSGWYAAVKRVSSSSSSSSSDKSPSSSPGKRYKVIAYGRLPENHRLRGFFQLNNGEVYAMSQNVDVGDPKKDGIFHLFLEKKKRAE